MRANGVEQPGSELFGERFGGLAASLVSRSRSRAGVALDRGAVWRAAQEVPWRELARGLEDCQRGRDRVERQVRVQSVAVDVPREVRLAQQRLELRGEADASVPQLVVQRFDPEAIARKQQAALAPVPDRDREHAAQARHEARPIMQVEVQQDLGVAVRAKPDAAALEVGAQLEVVEDLA